MNNLLDFFEWRINEKVTVSDETVTINNDEYEIDNNGEVKDENTPKSIKKYISKLSDAADDAENAEITFETDRVTGGIKELKNKIKDKNINIKQKEFKEIIKNINKTYESDYIKLDGDYKDLFDIKGHAIGRGEVLLSVLYKDTRRHEQSEKGDNIIIKNNNKDGSEIEVKSAGASMPIKTKRAENTSDEYICAYSIARYIIGRNLGQIYLVIFDNGIKKISDTGDFNKDTTNYKESKESTESSNENGDKNTNGFFIMNCGNSVNPTSNKCIDKANELAEQLEKIIKVNNKKGTTTERKKFIFEYDSESKKIICTIV